MVFRHLYQTLVEADCEGNLEPALAVSWTENEQGRVWTFVLDPDARFWDGAPVLAGDVIASWTATRQRERSRSGSSPWSWIHPDSLEQIDDFTLRVAMPVSVGASPAVFANASLAVARTDAAGWPEGSGSFAVDRDSPPDRLRIWSRNQDASARHSLTFQYVSTGDARDLMAVGVDLFWTADPLVLDYVETVSGFSHAFLAWDRTYFLVSPRVVSLTNNPGDPAGATDFRESLAADALSVDARAAHTWEDAMEPNRTCRAFLVPGSPSPPEGGPAARIVYPAKDPEAQRLAERLVALALSRDEPGQLVTPSLRRLLDAMFPATASQDLQAVDLPEAEFQSAMARGAGRAFLAWHDPQFPHACLEWAAFLTANPWLKDALEQDLETGRAIPLVSTGNRVVWRNGLSGVRTDWDGTLRLDTTGWSVEAPRP